MRGNDGVDELRRGAERVLQCSGGCGKAWRKLDGDGVNDGRRSYCRTEEAMCLLFIEGGGRRGASFTLKTRRNVGQWPQGGRARPWAFASGRYVAAVQVICAQHKECRGLLLVVLWLRSGRQGLKPSCRVGAAAVIGQHWRHGSTTNTWRVRPLGDFCPGNVGSGPRVGAMEVRRSGRAVSARLTGHVTAALCDVRAATR
jgi:hypothetical protein